MSHVGSCFGEIAQGSYSGAGCLFKKERTLFMIKEIRCGSSLILQARQPEKRTKKRRRKIVLFLLSFLLPMVLLIPALASAGIFPFGPNTTMAVDLRHEYVGFYEAFRHALHSPGGFIYNWNKALGGEMAGTFAYYMLSPLNLLFFLFPPKDLPYIIELTQILKVGLASLNFSILLHGKERGDGGSLILFSTLYGLISFTTANFLNHMWLDVVLLFPLVVYFMEKMLDGDHPLPYVLSLTLMILTNFYIAFMGCLFLVLYCLYLLVRTPPKAGMTSNEVFQDRTMAFIRFVGFSVIAAGLSCILLFPTLGSIRLSKGTYNSDLIPRWSLNYPPLDIFAKMVTGAFSYKQVPSGLPNIFAGTLANILVIFYFFQKSISSREKWAAFFIFLAMAFSMNIDAINIFWHGMQHPIWYEYRYSWLVSFFILIIGHRAWKRISFTPKIAFTIAGGIYLGLYIYLWLSIDRYKEFMTIWHLIAGLLTGLCFLFLLYLYLHPERKKIKRSLIFLTLVLLSIVEIAFNSAVHFSSFAYESLSEFAFFDSLMEESLQGIRPGKKDFYRLEKTFMHDNNDGMRFNYPGLTHFNSTLERNTIELLGNLGFCVTKNSCNGTNPTKVTDGLFAMEYYLQGKYDPQSTQPGMSRLKDQSFRPDLSDMDRIKETDFVKIYRLQKAMPLGILAERPILDFRFMRRNPLDNQDMIANFIDGGKTEINYFKRLKVSPPDLTNVRKSEDQKGLDVYERVKDGQKASLIYQFSTKNGSSHYITVSETLKDNNSKIYLDGNPLPNKRSGWVKHSQVYNVSSAADQDQDHLLEIVMDKKKSQLTINNISLFSFDEKAWNEAVDFQNSSGFRLTGRTDTRIEGTVNARDNTPYLLFSIPYNKGWSCFIDGNPVPIKQGLESLVMVPVKPGAHDIVLTYQQPYLFQGIIVSLVSLIFLIIMEGFYLAHRKKDSSKPLTNQIEYDWVYKK